VKQPRTNDEPTAGAAPAPPGGAAGPDWKRELFDELRAPPAGGAGADLGGSTRPTGAGRRVASALFEDHLRRGEGPRTEPMAPPAGPPAPADSLDRLLSRNDLLHSASGRSARADRLPLPQAGEPLFGFRLLRELGRGSFARVYLAEQADLAGRPVVLKVSALQGSEPQTLAQLQHTHIVPVYSLHEDAAAGLRALCMPYFGGASLDRVLRALGDARPARGAGLVAALDRVAGPPAGPALGDPAAPTPRALLAELPYFRAAAWVAARLAEALQHAHARGVLHRDIKPSNILLGADGTPMLLDFNLAQGGGGDDQPPGGTVAYMAPEHLRALALRDPALARRVDHRADVYALGMVLYEMLTGRSPFDHRASYAPLTVLIEAMAVERGHTVPSARRARPDVPWGLESITRRCLEPDPDHRYQRAEELAEDLRRFLDDRPLKYAPELSRAERLKKWARRHPRLSSSAGVSTVAAAALVAVGLLLAGVWGRLADSQARDRVRAFDAGRVRALCLVNTASDLEDHLAEGAAVCRETLGIYGLLDGPGWREPADWARLAPGERRRLAEDARELLLLLAGARARLAPGDAAARREALALADRAAAVPDLPPCRALGEERAAHLAALGDEAGAAAARAEANRTPPAGARDHYLLAMTFARQRQPGRALRHLDEAVRLNPRDYWSWMQRGLVRQERGEPALAAGDFGVCVGLWPEFAWGYFNRGCVLAQAGLRAEAVEDYTRALERDAGLLPARLNRGLVLLELGRHGPALADFDAAAARGRDDAALHGGRGAALEGLRRHAEADEAFRAAELRAASLPPAARARLRRAYGFAVAARLPDRAKEAFEDVLADDPARPEALYGLAMLAERGGRPVEALRLHERVLAAAPDFAAARRCRAVLLARLGDVEAAEAGAAECLRRDPSGASWYAAACVAALAAGHAGPGAGGPESDRALARLREAFARGYGADKAAADDDLAAVRGRPEFAELLAGSRAARPADE
jgi:serine/threonine protein kinase/Tfp pilus assembly protein PilF